MKKHIFSDAALNDYKNYLVSEEKSAATIEKYLRDIKTFMKFAKDKDINKQTVIEYKKTLLNSYKVSSVNSMLIALNLYFVFLGREDLKIKTVKRQREIYRPVETELTKEEYFRLCDTAEKLGKERTGLVIQTICSSGIRVGELSYITVEAVQAGRTSVLCKGKNRVIFIVSGLRAKLLDYIEKNAIKSGPVFVTVHGTPLGRINIWRDMKNLCEAAGVDSAKVYPHNLRHLFARSFYEEEKDIVKLADILGHSSIETTRMYTISTGKEHKEKMEKLNLIK